MKQVCYKKNLLQIYQKTILFDSQKNQSYAWEVIIVSKRIIVVFF